MITVKTRKVRRNKKGELTMRDELLKLVVTVRNLWRTVALKNEMG